MSNIKGKLAFLTLIGAFFYGSSYAETHKYLSVDSAGVENIRSDWQKYPLFKSSFESLKSKADKALINKIEVPVPKDAGGGYTHEKHKQNYQDALACANVFMISGDDRYAAYVGNMLSKYADMYEGLPLHPAKKGNQKAGKLFWQNLNDCVWQVYMIQAYQGVKSALTTEQTNKIEKHLFEPIVKFLWVDCHETFNRVHNHGTWCVAAVGMTGYVMNKPQWVETALKGSDKSGKAGFMAQLNALFSPDGYYTEGPYYQRYALLPFILFAKAINEHQPELKIFSYRDSVLSKAINTCLQLAYTNGAFFPINDAMKDKTYESEELVYGVDIAYSQIKADPTLLEIAKQQNRVIISEDGLEVAKGISQGNTKPFPFDSRWITDGENGKEGGIGILRAGGNKDQLCVVLKATAQGMGHGHFDKLNLLVYDNNTEILSDYGAARYLNIETKSGGDYLPENKTWAKQTIAHNTLVIDEGSHFNGDLKIAEKHHSNLVYFDVNEQCQVMSALDTNAYSGVRMQRTLIVLPVNGLNKPLLIDLLDVRSTTKHRFDLPFYYQGQITNVPFQPNAYEQLKPYGKANGYQHLWLNATGQSQNGQAAVTFLNKNRFYTLTTTTSESTKIDFVSLGANDPQFNLRNEKGFIVSEPSSNERLFVSVLEIHGQTDGISETTSGAIGAVKSVKVLKNDKEEIILNVQANQDIYTVTIHPNKPSSFIKIDKHGK